MENKHYIPLNNLLMTNTRKSNKPVIGVLFDFRPAPKDYPFIQKPTFVYFSRIAKVFDKLISKSGGVPFYIDPESAEQDFSFLDGLVIPGGRDIDPAFYNQPRSETTKIHPQQNKRFLLMQKIYSSTSCPVMGICWGLQFLNVSHGGSLVQQIPRHPEHLGKQRSFRQQPGSLLHGLLGAEAKGFCYHHQGIATLGENLLATSFDSEDSEVHGIELVGSERKVFAVLWHPEFSIDDTTDVPDPNAELFKHLVKLAEEFRALKMKVLEPKL